MAAQVEGAGKVTGLKAQAEIRKKIDEDGEIKRGRGRPRKVMEYKNQDKVVGKMDSFVKRVGIAADKGNEGEKSEGDTTIQIGLERDLEKHEVKVGGVESQNNEIWEIIYAELKGVKEEIRKLNNNNKAELEELKRMIVDNDRAWKEKEKIREKERQEDRETIAGLKQRIEQLERKEQAYVQSGELERKIEDRIQATTNKEIDRTGRIEKLLEKQERIERKNNIVLRGIEISGEINKEKIGQLFRQKLGVNRQPVWVKVNNNIIVIKMRNWEEKLEVMSHKKQLKGSTIFLDNDLTKEEREIQRKIWQVAKGEREKGKDVKIGHQKIRIDGKWVYWQEQAGREQVFH